MPSNHTTNYQLSQWSKDDRVLMEDFNADNAKIDAAIKAEAGARAAGDAALQTAVAGKADASTVADLAASQLRLVTGSYVGTGKLGPDNPNTLTFPFPPIIVGIFANKENLDAQGGIFVRGQTKSPGNSKDNLHLSLTWDGNSLTWSGLYYTENQLNLQSTRYYYFALG